MVERKGRKRKQLTPASSCGERDVFGSVWSTMEIEFHGARASFINVFFALDFSEMLIILVHVFIQAKITYRCQ
jgi:hypothetical protein